MRINKTEQEVNTARLAWLRANRAFLAKTLTESSWLRLTTVACKNYSLPEYEGHYMNELPDLAVDYIESVHDKFYSMVSFMHRDLHELESLRSSIELKTWN